MEYIIGIVVSLVVQFLKDKVGASVASTYLAILCISFVGAAIYVLIKDTSIWPTLVQVMTVAGAFYAFVIRRFEESE